MPSERALALQTELQQLKADNKQLRMRKSGPGSSPDAPFPISLDVPVQAPPGTRVDVEQLTLRLLLRPSLLLAPPDPGGLSVTVEGEPPLPPRLADEIAGRLHGEWVAATGAVASPQAQEQQQKAGGFGLAAVVHAARRQFPQLVSCMPEYLEAYEGVDELGATTRRFALVTADASGAGACADSSQEPAAGAAPSGQPDTPAQPTGTAAGSKLPPGPPLAAPRSSGSAPAGVGADPASGTTAGGRGGSYGAAPAQRASGAAAGPRRPVVPRPPVVPSARRQQAQGATQAALGQTEFDRDVQWLSTKFGAAVRLISQGGGAGQEGQQQEQQQSSREQLSQQQAGHYHHHQQQQQQKQQQKSFSLMLHPTDPAWGSRGPIRVTGSWAPPSTGGADQGAALHIQLSVHPTLGVPATLAACLEEALGRQAAAAARGGRSALRSALKWLEGYAAAAAAPTAAGRRQLGGGAAAGASSGSPGDGGQRSGGVRLSGRAAGEGPSTGWSEDDSSSSGDGGGSSDDRRASDEYEDGSSSERDEDGGGDGEEQGAGSPSGAAAVAAAAGVAAGGARGADAQHGGGSAYGVCLEGLQLDLIDALEILNMSVQLSCARCGAAAAASLAPGGSAPGLRAWEWRGACGRCSSQMWALLRPRVVHETNNEIAALKTEGCSPLDLLPSLFGAQCGNCSASVALRGVQVGMPASRNCPHCHNQLNLIVLAVAFIPKRPPIGAQRPRAPRGAAAGGDGRARGAGQPAVVVGQPLPFLGTCKHYRHSHRWLRFPCCGLRYPCDICHEEGADGHEMAWAKRMTCGYCSTEQAVADKCTACGKKVASSASNPSGRNTRFWEGGQGCRDPGQMSRKDPRRYRNSKSKTTSAKSKRVGPKPWS